MFIFILPYNIQGVFKLEALYEYDRWQYWRVVAGPQDGALTGILS
jgi:hypothetical protein